MRIIDSQIHVYERDRPERPWAGPVTGPLEFTGDDLVTAMDEAGVDGVLLVSPYIAYRYDPSYMLQVHAKYPGRFGLIKPVDQRAPDIDGNIASWASLKDAIGVRLIVLNGPPDNVDDPGLNTVLASAALHSLIVNMACAGRLGLAGQLAARHPNTRLVIDHLGIEPVMTPPVPAEPFADLPLLLQLARYDNVTVKVTAACTLSRKPFPYDDIWDPLCRVFDAFGIDRCMWGTDWARTAQFLTFEQAVDAFRQTNRLSETDKAALMGGTLMRVYDWRPTVLAPQK